MSAIKKTVTNRQIDGLTDRRTYKQKDRRTDRLTDRQTDEKKDRKTDRNLTLYYNPDDYHLQTYTKI